MFVDCYRASNRVLQNAIHFFQLGVEQSTNHLIALIHVFMPQFAFRTACHRAFRLVTGAVLVVRLSFRELPKECGEQFSKVLGQYFWFFILKNQLDECARTGFALLVLRMRLKGHVRSMSSNRSNHKQNFLRPVTRGLRISQSKIKQFEACPIQANGELEWAHREWSAEELVGPVKGLIMRQYSR